MEQESEHRKPNKKVSIVEIIMSTATANNNTIDKDSVQTTIEPKLITNTNFFTDENSTGIIDKAEFLKHVYGMNANQLIAFKTLFEQLTRGEPLNAPPYQKLDIQNRSYIWISNLQPKGDLSYKVLTTNGLCQLIGIYQFGLYRCDLSLEGLYEEATRLVSTNHTVSVNED